MKAPTGAAPTAGMRVDIGAQKEIRLSDPFLLQFFSAWQAERNLPYEVNDWALRVLRQDFVGAAHLLSAIETRSPETFRPAVASARAYLYWNLSLSQTFFDEWLRQLSEPTQRDSRLEAALELTIQKDFDRWLLANAIEPSVQAQTVIAALDTKRSALYATLQGWTLLRKAEAARPILELLPSANALKPLLARSVAVALARKQDLAGAALILKRHLEPSLDLSGDPKALAMHYLQIARLLYQAGALEAAEQYYGRIPSGTPEFVDAQEELTWVWLRTGNWTKLRGQLVTLGSGLFDDKFTPEVYLVRAISNLKLCYYEDVEKDFRDFLSRNGKWAKRIDEALKAGDPPAPPAPDFFSRLADTAIVKRQAEAAYLDQLSEQSVGAALPAVGIQGHWQRAKIAALAALEVDRKLRAQEYRRQWSNLQGMLQEAIRKMRFVKVELLTQMHALAVEPPVPPDSSQVKLAMNGMMKAEASDMNFPFDGVIWPDELFRLRSVARGRCPGTRH